MKTAHALENAPRIGLDARRPSRPVGWLIARLRALLADGDGPCYIRTRADALSDAPQAISECLNVAD